MKTPIFSVEEGWMNVFSSPEAAEGEIEAIEIEGQDYYTFYDADGTILAPELVDPPGRFRKGTWKLREPPGAHKDPAALRSAILDFFTKEQKGTGVSPDSIRDFTLQQLVELAAQFIDH
jgi:hypothetical protein